MIKFGTDGWRDVIADSFTFENVRDVAQALSDYLNEIKGKEPLLKKGISVENSQPPAVSHKPRLVIGYDTRFLSDIFAKEAALVAAANNIEVFLTESFAPTPAVSCSTVDMGADGAVLITASHNPPQYNGLKFKAPYGGSATPEITRKIEEHYIRNQKENKKPKTMNMGQAQEKRLLRFFNPKEKYIARLLTILDKDLISSGASRRLSVVADPLYGAGQGYLKDALLKLGCEVEEIHGEVNPDFGGLNPEPIAENLRQLKDYVVEGNFDAGFALDGDADRAGAIDASGMFVNSHQIFALLLEHLVVKRGWCGDVVKTVSTTQMIDILAQEYKLNIFETPVGFKYICEHILEKDFLIGGEESGGIGVKNYIPERDGILISLLLVEIMLANGKTLGQLINELMDRIGHFYYDRWDVEIDHAVKPALLRYLKRFNPGSLLGRKVSKINNQDGYKYYLENNGWLMIRASGTEAVVRLYAEAESAQKVSDLLKTGKQILDSVSDAN